MSELDLLALKEIVKRHINKSGEFDPFHSFPGVETAAEFSDLIANDPAFGYLGLGDERYVTARLGGNFVTSLHRKIGDMYEEIFHYLIKAKFGLNEDDLNFKVDVQIGERVQTRSTDGVIPIEKLGDITLPIEIPPTGFNGLGFEVRCCYQIGDSKRIQADWDMALALEEKGYVPIMLIFCATSLRSPVTRLSQSWNLYTGMDTFEFIKQLTGFDLYAFLDENKDEFRQPIEGVLSKF